MKDVIRFGGACLERLLTGLFLVVSLVPALVAQNPVPVLSDVSPHILKAGSGAFRLEAYGAGFVPGSQVRWNGSARNTTFVDSTHLVADIAALDVANAGTVPVAVFNPSPGGGLSNEVSFTITVGNPAPHLYSIFPTILRAGSHGFTLELYGEGFVPESEVRWNGVSRPTTFVGSMNLQAEIPVSDVAVAGTVAVTVYSPTPAGGSSEQMVFTITAGNPQPHLWSIYPSTLSAGSPGITLELFGEGFVPESEVRWNGSSRKTSYISFSSLTAEIPATDLATAGIAQVTVFSPSPDGGTSEAVDFAIAAGNPIPVLASIRPDAIRAGSPGIILQIYGEGFVPQSQILWNEVPRKTTYVDLSNLYAEVSSSDLAAAGTALVSVSNPSPGGGYSGTVAFTITAGNPVPRLNFISPDVIRAGSPGFTLDVFGDRFVPGCQVLWNGLPRNTVFNNSESLSVAISASDISVPGNVDVSVINPEPGGGLSAPTVFSITAGNPLPRIFSLSPSAMKSGGASFQLRVYGSRFSPGSQVLWNGSPRRTTFQSFFELTAEITVLDIVTPSQAGISVSSPTPGGGLSGTIPFTVSANNLVPDIADISPDAVVAGGEGFDLTVTGANFVSNSVVQWNGSPRATTFLNSTQVQATINAVDVAVAGTVRVAVLNPPPGGGPSGEIALTVSSSSSPVPVIEKMSPVSAQSGGPGFTLTISGSGFVSRSVVRWNGSDRPTTYESSTMLTAVISAGDFFVAGSAYITVFNPSPGGGESDAARFIICSGICLAIVSPNVAPLGAGDYKFSLFGNDFVGSAAQSGSLLPRDSSRRGAAATAASSVVLWNGQPLNTIFISRSQLTAAVPAGLLSTAGTASISVTGGGGGSSNSVPIPISLVRPAPILSALNPPGVQPGGVAFNILVQGTNFVGDSKVLWNGVERQTNFIDSTQLKVAIPASDIATPAVATISVRNQAPGGGTSNEQAFVFANSLYFPRLVSRNASATGAGEYTGLALVNLGDREATLTFTAYSKTGDLISGPDITNPIALALGARHQLPTVDYQIFGAGLPEGNSVGWVRVGSSENRVLGFFLSFDDRLSVLDGADVSATTFRTSVITELEDQGFTQFHVVNPDTKPASILFELYRSDGTQRATPVSRTLDPNAVAVETFQELFPGISPQSSDYVRIVSGRGVSDLDFMGKAGQYVYALNGQDADGGATTLYSPQYVVGGNQWRSTLSLVNLESFQGKVTVRLIGDDGAQIGLARTETIAARGKLYISDQKYFIDAGGKLVQGYLEIVSDGPRLAGSVVFGDQDRKQFASSLPLVSSLQDTVVFGQLASNATYFTGLAILNPNKTAAKVALEVFDENGGLLASGVLDIPAGHRVSQLLTQFFPGLVGQNRSLGYFRLTSDQKVASFALFGTNDLSVLSAIPPQIVP